MQALKDFLDAFDSIDRDGSVTLAEFEEYYASISAVVDDDNYFQLMLWNAWQLDKPNPRAPVSRCVCVRNDQCVSLDCVATSTSPASYRVASPLPLPVHHI